MFKMQKYVHNCLIAKNHGNPHPNMCNEFDLDTLRMYE